MAGDEEPGKEVVGAAEETEDDVVAALRKGSTGGLIKVTVKASPFLMPAASRERVLSVTGLGG